jgi:DNA-binding response OmpR family regulator
MATAYNPERAAGELSGYQVLVVEDDYLIAQEMAASLRERGAQVFGPVPDVPRGRSLARQRKLDCALLDINLKGKLVYELAHELIESGVRPIFTTGYDPSFLPAELRHEACLQKPIDAEDLVRIILGVAPTSASPATAHERAHVAE